MSHIETVRHDRLSLFQSMVDDVIHLGRQRDGLDDTERPTKNHPLVNAATSLVKHLVAGKEPPEEAPEEVAATDGGSVAWHCIKLASELFLAKIEGKDEKTQELEDALKDSTCDPGWVEAILDYLKYFGPLGKKGKIPYVTYQKMDDFVLETLPRNARVAIVGDWATGTDDAVDLMRQVASHRPQVLMHLGDIYYSGTERETHANFLDILNEVFDRDENPVAVYTLTGNHDMYSGGLGYYGILPQLNPEPLFRPEQAQPASFFCLRSPGGAWQLLGMDTGLHDHDPFDVTTDVTYLEPTEETWHQDKIRGFASHGGRSILFSHHQLFSAYERIGGDKAKKPAGEEAYNPKLLASFREEMRKGWVAAWFWGHERNLEIYEPYGPLAKGRCLGHGAIPVFTEQNPYEVDDALPNPPRLVRDREGQEVRLQPDEDGVFAHGYAILDLDDDRGRAEVAYYVETDAENPVYREELS